MMKYATKYLICSLFLFTFATAADAVTREYWIAADEVLWDFAPSFPINAMTGEPFTADQRVFVEDFVGRKYWKAVYREYTPGFAQLKQRGPNEEHLGILGPILRAEVGDELVIHFKNNASFTASMHPHGVFYDKASEGAPYADNNGQKGDDFVPPGGEYTYVWGVPERAGPGPNDLSSIMWEYHSHTDETGDTNAGLVGPIIITAKGKANPDGSPKGVDREFVTLFTVFNENASSLADKNLTGIPGADLYPDAFEESNLMHGMNGLVFGNNTGYVMKTGEIVRWYIIGMGTEVDLHTPHWHGATLLWNGNRIDVAEILPAATKTYEMTPDNPGKWMYHCHVNDHIDAGMMTTFTVQP